MNNTSLKITTPIKNTIFCKAQKTSILSFHTKATFLIVLFLLQSVLILGQDSRTSENKADSELKSSARINPSTLAMEFSIPLGGRPGRNGNSLPTAFNYTSKVWDAEITNSTYERTPNTQCNPTSWVTTDYTKAKFKYSRDSYAGWSSSLSAPSIVDLGGFYNLAQSQTSNLYSQNIYSEIIDNSSLPSWYSPGDSPTPSEAPQCNSVFNTNKQAFCTVCVKLISVGEYLRTESCLGGGGGGSGDPCHGGGTGGGSSQRPPPVHRSVKRIRVKIPGGSNVEFRLDDKIHDCTLLSAPGTNPCFSRDGNYLAVDGSGMKFKFRELQPDGTTKNTLFLPDGSRYIFGDSVAPANNFGEAVEYFDVHGNKMTFNPSQRKWTDTMGNLVDDPFDLPNPQKSNPVTETNQYVNLPGLSGNNRQAQMVWKRLKTPGCEATSAGCGESVLENPAQELKYIGSEGCVSSATGGPGTANVYQPALFQGSYQQTGSGALATHTYKQVCGDIANETTGRFNPVVLSEIILPDGNVPNENRYEFRYNIYGEITKIKYPTGAVERFRYDTIDPLGYKMDQYYKMSNRGVVERWVYSDEQQLEQHWGYSAELLPAAGGGSYVVKTFAPDGTLSERWLKHAASDDYFSNFLDGMAYDEKFYSAADANNNRTLLRRNLTEWTQDGPLPGGAAAATRNPRPVKNISIIVEDGQALATMTETIYDTNSDPEYFASLNAVQSKNYKYKVLDLATAQSAATTSNTISNLFSSSDVETIAEMDYLYDANYKARNINGLVTETRIKDASGTIKAKSKIDYDQQTYLEGVGVAIASWENPNTILRGLPTTAKSWWDVAGNQYIETHTQYDQFGNAKKMWDGKGNFSEVQYADNYADNVNRNSYAFPTKTISYSGNNGGGTMFETSIKYDFNTGLPISTTDVNGQISTMEYNDALLRPTRAIAPNGHQTITEYGAGTSATNRFVKVKTQIDETKWKEDYSWYDGLGRTVKTQSVDTNGDVFALICYDQFGRMSKASNPFRNITNPTCSSSTLEWTTNTYDAAGRVWKVTTPDGAFVETLYGVATSGNNIGTVVTVKDQALKERRSITNALGQLTRVDEPTATGLGTIGSPNQATYYEYDTLNNLTTVKQGGTLADPQQTRSFVYDSLSRLKSANNPESGLIQYTYDNNGNLQTKRDARGIKTIYDYDALNRVNKRCYRVIGTGALGAVSCAAAGSETVEPNTSDVSYFYDNLPNAKGKLIKVENAVSKTEYQVFDAMGRVTQSQQTTGGAAYGTPMTYTYNLSGALIEQKYPSGRVVKNVLDNDGDLSMVQSKKNAASGYFNYAKNFTSTAAGAVSSMQLGNGKWESTQFNSRLQPTQIALGTVQNGTDKLKLDYEYGKLNWDGTILAGTNNGNVAKQTITTPTTGATAGFTAVQYYAYDELNRIQTASETMTQNGQTTTGWTQEFQYDRYGNRWFNATNTTTLEASCPTAVCNPTIDPATNKLVSYTFDNAGNTKVDALGKQFDYDGENKQILVKNSSNIVIGEYFYDSDGKRVKKITGSEITIFIYDASGKMVAEYASTVASSAQARVSYLTNDHLGSPRINTDAGGKVFSRRDFMPFGEEIDSTDTWQRNVNLNYGEDGIRQKFTGYEKDEETDLDFAQARMFRNSLGRFTSPDPAMVSASVDNPQTWNRYVYVLNNPLKYSDPLGLWEIDPNYETNDKGKKKVTGVKVILKKEDGDDAKTLSKQLKISEKAAQKLLDKADSNGNIRLSEAGGSIGNVFKNIEKILVAYEQFKIDNPNEGDNNGQDCSLTASFLATGGTNTQNGVGALDQFLGQMGVDMNGNPTGMRANARSVKEKDLQIGDIVRYALDSKGTATHFTTFLMLNKNGEPFVFSKNGETGPYSFERASAYEGRKYGNITPLSKQPNGGATGDKTGYYRPLK